MPHFEENGSVVFKARADRWGKKAVLAIPGSIRLALFTSSHIQNWAHTVGRRLRGWIAPLNNFWSGARPNFGGGLRHISTSQWMTGTVSHILTHSGTEGPVFELTSREDKHKKGISTGFPRSSGKKQKKETLKDCHLYISFYHDVK